METKLLTTKKLWRKPLDEEKIQRREAEVFIIADRCKGCGYCITFCPKEVLEESEEINQRGVHPPKVKDISKCALCGFCTAICPDFAIFVKEKPSGERKEGEKKQ